MQAIQAGLSLKESMDTTRIAKVECFRFDDAAAKLLVPGCGRSDCCGMLKLSAATGAAGSGVFWERGLKGDFIQWACAFQRMKHATLAEGLREALLKHEAWGDVRTAAFVTALRELARGCDFPAREAPLPEGFGDPAYCFEHADAYVIF